MLQRKEFVDHGDWVIINDSSNTPRMVQAIESQSFSTKEGNFINSDLIGKRFGGKLYNNVNSNFVHILYPTPYLWPGVVDCRTQILFQQDISLIQYLLDLKPGSVVIESGTGSGVLTTSLARSVAPHGHVHTFEFHPERVQKARHDFSLNKVSDVVTTRHRDILERGFPYFPQGVDAAFLDLPSPHDVIPSVDRSLRPQGRICNFSPCIEQVQRVCLKLQELGYEDIITVEILVKEYELLRVQPSTSVTYNQNALLTGIVTANGPLGTIQGNQYTIGQASFLNENERQMTARNRERLEKTKLAKAAAAKKATDATTTTTQENTNNTTTTTTTTTTLQTENTNTTTSPILPTENTTNNKRSKPNPTESLINNDNNNQIVQLESNPTIYQQPTILNKVLITHKPEMKLNIITRPTASGRGHTGYLTFARKRSNTTPKEGIEYATPFTKSSLTGK